MGHVQIAPTLRSEDPIASVRRYAMPSGKAATRRCASGLCVMLARARSAWRNSRDALRGTDWNVIGGGGLQESSWDIRIHWYERKHTSPLRKQTMMNLKSAGTAPLCKQNSRPTSVLAIFWMPRAACVATYTVILKQNKECVKKADFHVCGWIGVGLDKLLGCINMNLGGWGVNSGDPIDYTLSCNIQVLPWGKGPQQKLQLGSPSQKQI